MTRVQELGFEALRCKQLPFRAKPFAEVLSRSALGTTVRTRETAILNFLTRTAEWKSPTGKRVKKELRAMLERGMI